MLENSSNLAKKKNAYRFKRLKCTPNRINPPKLMPRHIIMKLLKTNNKYIHRKQPWEKCHFTERDNDSNNKGFLISTKNKLSGRYGHIGDYLNDSFGFITTRI